MTKDDSFPKLSDDLRQELKKDRGREKRLKRIIYPLISLTLIFLFIFGLWKVSFKKGLSLKDQSNSKPKIQNTPKLTPSPSPPPTPDQKLTPPPEPTPTPTPIPTSEIYTVVSGDTLLSIAAKFGVSVEAIAQANGLAEPYFLSIGDKLTIPK